MAALGTAYIASEDAPTVATNYSLSTPINWASGVLVNDDGGESSGDEFTPVRFINQGGVAVPIGIATVDPDINYQGDYSPYRSYVAGDTVTHNSVMYEAQNSVAQLYPTPMIYSFGTAYGAGAGGTITPSWPPGVVNGETAIILHWRPTTGGPGFTLGGVAQTAHSSFTASAGWTVSVFFITVDTSKTLSFTTSSDGRASYIPVGPGFISATVTTSQNSSSGVATHLGAGKYMSMVIVGGSGAATFTVSGGDLYSGWTTGGAPTGFTRGIEEFMGTVTRTAGTVGSAGYYIQMTPISLTLPDWKVVVYS